MMVAVNSLWFLSLSFGLITASAAILVKQWIREHMALNDGGWRFCLNRWGMTRYRVYEIAACLPLLLQLALILFFAGLVLFVHTFNPFIGWLVSATVIPWFVGFSASIIASMLDPSCPYRTPVLPHITRFYRSHHTLRRVAFQFISLLSYFKYYRSALMNADVDWKRSWSLRWQPSWWPLKRIWPFWWPTRGIGMGAVSISHSRRYAQRRIEFKIKWGPMEKPIVPKGPDPSSAEFVEPVLLEACEKYAVAAEHQEELKAIGECMLSLRTTDEAMECFKSLGGASFLESSANDPTHQEGIFQTLVEVLGKRVKTLDVPVDGVETRLLCKDFCDAIQFDRVLLGDLFNRLARACDRDGARMSLEGQILLNMLSQSPETVRSLREKSHEIARADGGSKLYTAIHEYTVNGNPNSPEVSRWVDAKSLGFLAIYALQRLLQHVPVPGSARYRGGAKDERGHNP